MTIIPAIDLLGGECVRLTQGDYAQVDVYSSDPVAVAQSFVAAGARRIHIVDLDAARGNPATNRAVIGAIRAAVACTIELGGGIRAESDVEELVGLGVNRLVVGTTFARRPEVIREWSARYGARFIAGIDARDGVVCVQGWEQRTEIQDVDLAATAREMGACAIIYTNIARDGMLGGPDIDGTSRIAAASGLPVILSGGIGSADDIERVANHSHQGVVGVIAGKAVYTKALSLPELFAKFPGTEGGTPW
ncbi:MAG: 1-(5-phosphoribosyl)-5-[(5-phosphoribosylamino)methylideneamino]imidazole-4-carboxamide isomerase [Spirochaetaceae bacterium]|nr:MAG: 1-(5-phosphoribosyl)-5-[(5-phosphoribosylamino)methylideneamino]imidazole-4-carboxamide isomerase [Spirochaetaceae bacterium]